MNTEHIILFDGVCNLCNGLVLFIIKRDASAKFKFASLQSAKGKELLNKVGLSTSFFHSIVYVKNDNYYLKSSAILHILNELGGFYKFLYFFILLPEVFRDFIYELISRKRYQFFGKRETCMVPTPELKDRFLE